MIIGETFAACILVTKRGSPHRSITTTDSVIDWIEFTLLGTVLNRGLLLCQFALILFILTSQSFLLITCHCLLLLLLTYPLFLLLMSCLLSIWSLVCQGRTTRL